MAEEGFLVTTLPHTAAADAPFHVSLFITHRLTPDGDSGLVSDFPRVADWTNLVGQSRLTLTGHGAGGAVVTIPATMLTDVLQPDLWPRVFPGELTVLPWQVPNHTATPWRTFAAHRMQAHALLMHIAAIAASPTAPPSVAGNPLTRAIFTGLGLGQQDGRIGIEDVLTPELDNQVTRYLDDVSGQGFLGRGLGPDGAAPGQLLVADVHRARCYYARPEEEHDYYERPVEGAKAAPVTKPVPDFHARASLLGDLSPLLRRLGLVVDVRVDDVATLAGLVDIQAHLAVPDLANVIRVQPRTACEVVGSGFYTVAAGPDYTHGMLRLGDEQSFAVLDLDPDASALKLEQYVRNLPRMSALENNGDTVTSAPSTLRATGFALARIDRAQALHDRLDGAAAKDAALVSGFGEALRTEDVTRGVRLEVWDDVSGLWHSLHRRRLDVEVEGAGEVLLDEPDAGFLQGASLTRTDGKPDAPANAHEVLAGWDGWSLSAPRPGKVVVHEDGEERVVDAPDVDPDPVNPVASSTRVQPGSLPRLRYGRSYAFRAWTADLAGNSSPHTVVGPDDDGGGGGGETPDAAALDETAQTVALSHLANIAREATVPTTAPEAGRSAVEALRSALRETHPIVRPGPRPGSGAAGVVPGTAITGHPDLDRLVLSRRADTAGSAAAAGRAITRDAALQDAFATHAMTGDHLLERLDAQTPAAIAAAALVSAALSGPARGIAVLVELADLLTTPRPFLRWEPVLEPTVVPRHPYSEGESQLALAIRSGADLPATPGDAPVIVAPADFLAATNAAHPELDLQWQATAQRHLAPPKVSQYECELHGRFDDAMGGGTTDDVRHALALAMREAGSFLEDTVADLDNPGGRLPQPGVSFHATPTAETPTAATPADLTRGDPLTPGQYVIHDVDELVVPYLPDPLANGISLVFPDAGHDSTLTGLLAVEGTTLPYPGSWPTSTPFRLVLTTGDTLGARVDGNVLEVTVPPGEQLRLRLSSSLEPAGLNLLGLWRSLPQAVRDIPLIAEAAADGWFWWLTPGPMMRLVHAVPRPVEAPRVTMLLPLRSPGDTTVMLLGGVDVHGPSTERLDVEATWTEQVDDIAKPGPETVSQVAAAAHTDVRPDEDLVVLFGEKDADTPLPDGSTLHTHAAVHRLGDTRHRRITYSMRATTRYREYFDPRVLPTPDDVSIVGPTVEIDVPSSARPAKSHVRDTLPLLRWSEETEPNQPFALRRTRGCGVRLYLERPWFSSGDDEVLGVLVAPGSDALVHGWVSEWGADPVFAQEGPASRAQLPLLDLLHLVGLDDRVEGGRPVGPPVTRPLTDLPGSPSVLVVSYQPEFSYERGLWFVDVALDPGTAFWPFVRFAVVRHQPSSVGNLHLSPVLRTDFVQLTPPRTATLSRPEAGQARLVVTGPVGVPRSGLSIEEGLDFTQKVALTRLMRARLERRVPSVGTDLGWTTEAAVNLPVLGFEGTVVSWSGTLDLPVPVPPRLPGQDPDWRVVLEEWELLPADAPHGELPRREARIVYADHLPL